MTDETPPSTPGPPRRDRLLTNGELIARQRFRREHRADYWMVDESIPLPPGQPRGPFPTWSLESVLKLAQGLADLRARLDDSSEAP
ncbi:hypothetical protein [Streptomyces sp. NPDC020141]|uniref:hypothetical protein n=1 Tax=Streptomyces sp. NPDC020141 TaxID=3365065 RepID=UPI0037AF3517